MSIYAVGWDGVEEAWDGQEGAESGATDRLASMRGALQATHMWYRQHSCTERRLSRRILSRRQGAGWPWEKWIDSERSCLGASYDITYLPWGPVRLCPCRFGSCPWPWAAGQCKPMFCPGFITFYRKPTGHPGIINPALKENCNWHSLLLKGDIPHS